MANKKIGVYIHIPFCMKKCIYCDFISYTMQDEDLQKKYINSLKKEIQYMLKSNTEIETVYIGGGTPSCINSKYIVDVLNEIKKVSKNDISEITIEVNPGTVTKQKLIDYKNAGITRLSIGLQSTENRLLKKIGRIHNYEDFLVTYELARKTGFENINVDLMIGLPGQQIKDVQKSLKQITELKYKMPEHISVYSLIIEENTPMQKYIDEGKFKLPNDEQERKMHWCVKKFLEKNEYIQYEISNFAKKGFESKHNLDCWSQKEYIGFGVAAHSYINNMRFHNISNIKSYINNIEQNNFEQNVIIDETQSKEEQMKEYMLLGFRKLDGISIKEFQNKFHQNPLDLFKQELNKLNQEKLIIIDDDVIKLSKKGLDFANIVFEEFI